MNWNEIDRFAGGLAQGIHNGMHLYDLYETVQDRKDRRQGEREIRAAMRDAYTPAQGQADPQDARGSGIEPAPVRPASAQPAPGLSAPQLQHVVRSDQAYPPSDTPPTNSTPQPVAQGTQGTQGTPRPTPPAAPDEGGQYLQSLGAGIRAALKRGDADKAQALFAQREQFASARDGQRRQQALHSALGQFQASGDPNTLLDYANQYLGSTQQYTRVTRAQDSRDGQAMYVVHGIDHTSGQPFAHPVSHTQLMQMAHAIADPSVHKRLAVQEWDALDALRREKDKARIKTEAAVREFEHKTPVEQRNRLEVIRAQGDQTRMNQGNAARHERTGTAPADVRTAQWLVEAGIAPDPQNAWAMVRSLKDKPRGQQVQDLSVRLLAAKDDLGSPLYDPETTMEHAIRLLEKRDALLAQQNDGPDGPSAQTPVPSLAGASRPASPGTARVERLLGLDPNMAF